MLDFKVGDAVEDLEGNPIGTVANVVQVGKVPTLLVEGSDGSMRNRNADQVRPRGKFQETNPVPLQSFSFQTITAPNANLPQVIDTVPDRAGVIDNYLTLLRDSVQFRQMVNDMVDERLRDLNKPGTVKRR